MIELAWNWMHAVYHLFLDMSPYLVLGMAVTGLLSVVLKPEFIVRFIGSSSLSSIVKASLFGVPLPLCSCGVLPTAVFLKDSGASKPAVHSFLISTPQTGADSIIATYGMLGPVMAVYRPVTAFLLGILGGISAKLTGSKVSERRQPSVQYAGNLPHSGKRTFSQSIKAALRYGFVDFTQDIGTQFVIGVCIAGAITILVPDDYFTSTVFGQGIGGMFLMVLIGVPMYICSTSSIPIALALMDKGISPGAALVFLAAGSATNAATLSVLLKKIGLRETMSYLVTLIAGSVLFGLLLDWGLSLPGTGTIILSAPGQASDLLPAWITAGSGLLLAALLVYAWLPKSKKTVSK